jgi:hypothetical protein
MVMDMRRHDDDDDYVVRDQERVRVPLHLMDSTQRAVAGLDLIDRDLRDHQPGFRAADTTDARQAARDARDQYVRRLSDSWRMPARDQQGEREPDNDPDDPGARMRSHLQTESSVEAQAKRDRIWAQYRDQLGQAWRMGRTNPQAATAIERQRRTYTYEGGR